MTTDQATQLAQFAFIAILIVPSLIILGVMSAIAWMVVPRMLKQGQQLVDNNAQLTKIVQQNSNQIATAESALKEIPPALEKQTLAFESALNKQTDEIKTQ